MIYRAIWERYLLGETLKIFFLFLLSFCFLYIVIDYSLHLQEIIKGKKIPLVNLTLYYAMLLNKRSDLLLPLSLLIATLKVLCSFNRKNELLAFRAGGISTYRLTRPFFLISSCCIAMNYFNSESLIPRSLAHIDRFEKEYFQKQSSLKKKVSAVRSLSLEDGSRLIYREYNRETKELFDVYWACKTGAVWHMKQLSLQGPIPIGIKVDILHPSEEGLIEKRDSHDVCPLNFLKLDPDLKHYIGTPIEHQTIRELLVSLKSNAPALKDKRSLIQTHLYFKLLIPCLPLFVIIGIAPYAIRFSRDLSVFLLFSLGIFGYLAFFMIINASVILGESHAASPFWALFTVPTCVLSFFGYNFFKVGRSL